MKEKDSSICKLNIPVDWIADSERLKTAKSKDELLAVTVLCKDNFVSNPIDGKDVKKTDIALLLS